MCDRRSNGVISNSLLQKLELKVAQSKEPNSDFCLGLPGWCPCLSCSPPPVVMDDRPMQERRDKSSDVFSEEINRGECSVTDATACPKIVGKRLSLKRRKQDYGGDENGTAGAKVLKRNDRFSFDIQEDSLLQYKEGEIPANTAKNTEWAYRNFESWRIAKNAKCVGEVEKCPDDILLVRDKTVMCDWLCKFVLETRRTNGEEYTPRSLYLLLSGLQRYMRKYQNDVNIFQDIEFKPLKNCCDSLFKQLHAKGIGADRKETPALSSDEEDKLWEIGVIGIDNPLALLRAVFFYNGKNFCLRGGKEQRELKFSQLKKESKIVDGTERKCYVYSEHGSKNRQGGFNSLNMSNKVVCQYECLSESVRCHVKILDKYLQVVPAAARESNNAFYLKPLDKVPTDPSKPWFANIPVGRNRLDSMLKEMCQQAGISGTFTNHSLRAYGATTMFNAGVSQKLVQERTGHRSLKALHQYERSSEKQLLDVTNIMSGNGSSVSSTVSQEVQSKSMSVSTNSSYTPNIVFSGCTFTGCAVELSGKAVNQNTHDYTGDLLNGITLEDIVD